MTAQEFEKQYSKGVAINIIKGAVALTLVVIASLYIIKKLKIN